jgi:glycerate-2-kinase
MSKLSDDAHSVWTASVDAVRAKPLVCGTVQVSANRLTVQDRSWDLSRFKRIVIVGAGKAATAMTQGLVDSLGDCLPTIGWINVPEGTQEPIDTITVHPARPAGVNEPTEAGVIGTKAILDLVANAKEDDLCIALISGGGSALLPAPVDGITLADKQAVTRFLSGAGANIAELNTVRKKLSHVKGGGLLRACRAGELLTLVLSDVLGDPLDLIASGPTVPDTSTPQDALKVLGQYDPDKTLPPSIRGVLDNVSDGDEKVTCRATTLVIGNNRVAVDSAGRRAAELGYVAQTSSADQCEGEAEELGRQLAAEVVSFLNDGSLSRPKCIVSGGEPTVKLADASVRGKGGRNQQLVLAAYLHLLTYDLEAKQWERLAILSGGTDGEDGPTDAAGAFIDADVHRCIVEKKLDGSDFLNRNDAYTFFKAVGGLLTTGPTGTNVCDVRVALVLA